LNVTNVDFSLFTLQLFVNSCNFLLLLRLISFSPVIICDFDLLVQMNRKKHKCMASTNKEHSSYSWLLISLSNNVDFSVEKLQVQLQDSTKMHLFICKIQKFSVGRGHPSPHPTPSAPLAPRCAPSALSLNPPKIFLTLACARHVLPPTIVPPM